MSLAPGNCLGGLLACLLDELGGWMDGWMDEEETR